MIDHNKGDKLEIRLGKYFINGLILLLPLLVTISVLKILIGFADNLLTAPLHMFPWTPPKGISLIVTILFIFLLGYYTTNIFITRFFHWLEKIMFKVPIVKTIYSTAKQINDILFIQKEKTMFRRVCIIPYPHPGVYSMGFITNESPKVVTEITNKDLLNVFIPTTPTPATGFLVMVPRADVIPLDISLDDALKIIVSGGVLSKHKFSGLL